MYDKGGFLVSKFSTLEEGLRSIRKTELHSIELYSHMLSFNIYVAYMLLIFNKYVVIMLLIFEKRKNYVRKTDNQVA